MYAGSMYFNLSPEHPPRATKHPCIILPCVVILKFVLKHNANYNLTISLNFITLIYTILPDLTE